MGWTQNTKLKVVGAAELLETIMVGIPVFRDGDLCHGRMLLLPQGKLYPLAPLNSLE